MKKFFIFVLMCAFCSADVVSDEQKFGTLHRQNSSFSKNNKEAQEVIVTLIYTTPCEYGFCANEYFIDSLSDELHSKIDRCLEKGKEKVKKQEAMDQIVNRFGLDLHESLLALEAINIYTKDNITSVRFDDKYNELDRDYVFECNYNGDCKIKDINLVEMNLSLSLLKLLDAFLVK